MTRVCASCGTEVEGDALFCPTCGQPMASGAEPELPAAPDWPELPPRPVPEAPAEPDAEGTEAADETDGIDETTDADAGREPDEGTASDEDMDEDEASARPSASEEPVAPVTHGWEQPVSEQPVPPWRRGAAFRSGDEAPARAPEGGASTPPAAPGASDEAGASAARGEGSGGASWSRPELAGVVRVPALLSDWCAGAGALLALLAMFLPWRVAGAYTSGWGLSSGVNLLYTIVILAVLAIVFLPDLLPKIPQRALVLLSVGLVGVGMGLDRLGQPLTGVGGTLFLIAALGIAVGGAVAQLGYDRPVGGPQA